MNWDAVDARPLGDHRMLVRFEDGTEGSVDVSQLAKFTGVFAPLQDPAYLAQVRIDPELGAVCWPNGADLDSRVLYSPITGVPLPEYSPQGSRP
jgi:hypothetical protein